MPDAPTPATAAPTAVWLERGLALALTLCFAIALVLKLNEHDGSPAAQFVLLGVAAVLALALVAVRRRGGAPDVSLNGHMSL
ncbi:MULTISPECIES: hypothetical protein [unclassified Blastococcus]